MTVGRILGGFGGAVPGPTVPKVELVPCFLDHDNSNYVFPRMLGVHVCEPYAGYRVFGPVRDSRRDTGRRTSVECHGHPYRWYATLLPAYEPQLCLKITSKLAQVSV
jgi:hypothetical protein